MIVLTLLVRDEADVLRSSLDFHLHAGVDLVIVTDNGSVDETPAILAEYEQRGVVHVIREPAGEFRQREWATRMARLAATEFGADWVISSDADEFWWPRGGSLGDVLGGVPHRYGIVQSFFRHFVPVGGGEGPFHERMIYRLSPQAPINDPTSQWRPFRKVVHRADPNVVVVEGSHWVLETALRPLRGWYPLEVLHFPVRSPQQLARKGAVWGAAAAKFYGGQAPAPGPGAAYHGLAFLASAEGRSGEYFDSLALGAEELERAIDEGIVVVDTRLRDMLRALGEGAEADDPRLRFARPSILEDARFAVDAAVLGEGDVVRTQRRLDELELRVHAVERTGVVRVERKLRTLARRWLRRSPPRGARA